MTRINLKGINGRITWRLLEVRTLVDDKMGSVVAGNVVGSIDVVFHNCLVRLDGDRTIAVPAANNVGVENSLAHHGTLVADSAAALVTSRSATHKESLADSVGEVANFCYSQLRINRA